MMQKDIVNNDIEGIFAMGYPVDGVRMNDVDAGLLDPKPASCDADVNRIDLYRSKSPGL